ncbi:MAG: response regulator [Defluviitaleaceae bacterium]|nr:response regulator [Defluviitaleaceae bacterium]
MENKGTILLVDNDFYLNNMNQNEFYRRGYAVLTATSYSEARAILNATEPDIIIMEVILPDGNGFNFCNEISGNTEASIVFLTVKSDKKDMIRGIKLGCDEYIQKPFCKDVMIARVEAIMRRRTNFRK